MCLLASLQPRAFSNDSSHAHACMSHRDPVSVPLSTTPHPPPPLPIPKLPLLLLALPPFRLDRPLLSRSRKRPGVNGAEGGVTGRMKATGWRDSAVIWRRLSSMGSGTEVRCIRGAADLTSPFVSRCLFVYAAGVESKREARMCERGKQVGWDNRGSMMEWLRK